MANFESFRWNFSSSTNPEIGRSRKLTVECVKQLHFSITPQFWDFKNSAKMAQNGPKIEKAFYG